MDNRVGILSIIGRAHYLRHHDAIGLAAAHPVPSSPPLLSENSGRSFHFQLGLATIGLGRLLRTPVQYAVWLDDVL